MFFGFYLYFSLFFLGAIIGSFINCYIWRTKNNKSVWRGRSCCLHCGRQLQALENVPIVSWLVLRGQCRICKKNIPKYYFIIELVTAGLFVLVGILNNIYLDLSWLHLVRDLFFVSILITVFVYDLFYQTILPAVIWFGVIVGLIFNNFLFVFRIEYLFLSVLVGGGFFFLQYIISHGKWIGDGDIFLGVMLGIWLGWPNIILGLFLAYIIGAIFSVGLLVKDKKYWTTALPFGVFLSLGAFITLYFGDSIIRWYSSFLF
jgi:leader peptidase (prepilin peptidase)/N-methyltransferase